MEDEKITGGPIKILICDDDPAIHKLVRTYLRSCAEMEYVLIEAGRKEEIQAALDEGGIDIVLLDIFMPDKSGMEWLMEIVDKRIAPVVMLTGLGSEEIAVQSLHEGAIDYISKDHLTKDRLWGSIKATLERWKRMQAETEKAKLMKELEAKNAELERFTYSVSHDLRSPLFTIQGFASILREDLEQNNLENVKKNLQYIENAATKMDRLLNDTLELSRIGRVTNPPEAVPFGELVQEALEQTSVKIESSGVEISVADDFPVVLVDPMRIVEVLVNLIVNSINYMGEQPDPKIAIGFRTDRNVFFVRDNGIGIAADEHEKVFDLFYRLDKSTEGTGVGLAVVKRIIEVQDGRVWIESEEGKGCTVCFTLPATKEETK